ncbi:MAG: lysophospholipase [Candidatus Thorarchaeota archaeon]|nr:lysophospholipase [Candidatus Thorarchaeota archaeon]
MSGEEEHYSGYDGTIMLLRVWKPEGEPRAVVLGFHGLGSHSGLLSFVAEQFASKGFLFYAPDMRGFGTYPGRKGHIESFNEHLEDMKVLVDEIKEAHPDEKMFMYGHSLGGVFIGCYILEYPNAPIDGLIMPCPAVSERLEVGKATRMIGTLLSKINVKTYIDNGLKIDLISRNQDVVQRNKEDPLRFDKATPRYAIEGLKASKRLFESANRIKLPVLVQQTGDDMILIPDKNKEFFDNINSEDKTWKFYPGLYHEPFEEPGGDEFLGDIFQWIENHL